MSLRLLLALAILAQATENVSLKGNLFFGGARGIQQHCANISLYVFLYSTLMLESKANFLPSCTLDEKV